MALATRPLAHLAGCASAFPRGIVDQATTIAGLQRLFPAEDPEKIRGIVESLGHRIATPAEARERLALKGAHHVAF